MSDSTSAVLAVSTSHMRCNRGRQPACGTFVTERCFKNYSVCVTEGVWADLASSLLLFDEKKGHFWMQENFQKAFRVIAYLMAYLLIFLSRHVNSTPGFWKLMTESSPPRNLHAKSWLSCGHNFSPQQAFTSFISSPGINICKPVSPMEYFPSSRGFEGPCSKSMFPKRLGVTSYEVMKTHKGLFLQKKA